MTAPLRDTYGLEVVTAERHPECPCDVPCQGRFFCADCGRRLPWCAGAFDDQPDTCNACYREEYGELPPTDESGEFISCEFDTEP